ncbi:Asp23/Gls24 family envelope stress response protein [Virgibacillus profundi]|uniref:Asp23/Gls24 family envelope stress response protein n=1 Tax=Virgibacillus profundi TaxID=2024555 RepID=A0A2A2ID93_9BACI|nr:Asp23/Gls24 family envelope stress response protein [Virgibacillus profundi]PAV29105.1 Asp23/Gls24 family envelope stress response protein [Virgibacillus profundi]PXY53274.1 Asp23/Gls24 family envelope stress response protein [Virgibacillus profundi]
MSEQPLLNVSEDTSLGKVEIAPEVIEVITGLAATEVDGLYAMRGNFASGVVERFGKKSHSKGVKVELTDNGILIDLFVVLNFGVSIPQVAQQLQTSIRQTLKNMTALVIDEINVHVVGIQMDITEDDSE